MNVRRAFTLIEILVVIAIIVTLMGLLLAVINTNQADIAATMAKIKQVAGSIEMYKLKSGGLPLTRVPAGDFSDTDISKISSRNHELRARLISVSPEYDAGGEHFYSTTEPYVATSSPALTPPILATAPSDCDCIVDLWNNPLVYKPYTAYIIPYPKFITSGDEDKYKPPKPRSYQIWSAGPDSIYQMNSANAELDPPFNRFETDPDKLDDSTTLVIFDDITNWTRVQN